jgi:hypothetical protein
MAERDNGIWWEDPLKIAAMIGVILTLLSQLLDALGRRPLATLVLWIALSVILAAAIGGLYRGRSRPPRL